MRNFLLRGSQLRNTTWINGLVIYTGRDTKMMQNITHSRYKISLIGEVTGSIVLTIFMLQVLLSFILAIFCMFWESSNAGDYNWFIPKEHNAIVQG